MEAPSSRSREPARVKLEKGPSSEEEDPDPVAPKSTDGSKGYPCSNHKLQPRASTGKRPHEEGGVGGSNNRSRTAEKKAPCSRGGSFTRVWSDEDEIAVLNGVIDFRDLNGRDPSAEDFFNFIKGKLQVRFSSEQISNKKRKLRERFLNALKKCESGSDPVFSKPHEDMIFQLSKKLWGNDSDRSKKKTDSKAKEASSHKEVVKEDNNGEKTEFWSKYPAFKESFHKMGNSPSFSISESGFNFVKERLSLIGSAKAKQLDDKWRQLIVKEMEIHCKQVEINNEMFALMTEQFKMAFDQ